MRSRVIRIAVPFLLAATSSEAQFQNRLYPFVELTDEMRAGIDFEDGSVEDWLEILGEPTLTALDFTTPPYWSAYDPSSFDFRVWLAWHDATNHLFVAAELVDDIRIVGEFGELDGHVGFLVDGDKSGGVVIGLGHTRTDLPVDMIQAQMYVGSAETNENGRNVSLFKVGTVSEWPDWMEQLPYADGGGAVVDSQPILWLVEFFVTPFDRLIWNDQEQTNISNLFPGKIIGFAFQLTDFDSGADGGRIESLHELLGPDATYSQDYSSDYRRQILESDLWASGILLGADNDRDGTAIKSVSWARIKASMSE